MDYLWCSILLNILGGIIAGLIVYFVIENRDSFQWQKSKISLIRLFNCALDRALTTIRILSGIKPPLGIQNDQQFLEYIKKQFGEDCKNLSEKIKNSLTIEKYNTLLVNIQEQEKEVKYLLLIFLALKKADSWYIENIIEFYNRTRSDFIVFRTFPEISNPKYQDDSKIRVIKNDGVNKVVDFCKFVLELKQHKNIRRNI